MFPDGKNEGLYHTADATLWFFHALGALSAALEDRITLSLLLPTLVDIAEHISRARNSTSTSIPRTDCSRRAQEGYQLTWMDAKMGDWVVTPRRGKAVEINALWFNALELLARLAAANGRRSGGATICANMREQARALLQRSASGSTKAVIFTTWSIATAEARRRSACRPNQIFAISLDHPVLEQERWAAVVDVVERELLTPVGLRSLSPKRSRLQTDLSRRPALARRRLSSGHGLGLADRAVHRRVAESSP